MEFDSKKFKSNLPFLAICTLLIVVFLLLGLVTDKKTKKLMFSNGQYTYIVCLARNEKEITYLHNVFKPENQKGYIKNVKKRNK